MKVFEIPVIDVITFTAESIMDASGLEPSVGQNQTPWG